MTTLQRIAEKLNVSYFWLWNLIKAESGANPQARNKITGARGLIQFLHSTARNLGYKDADDLAAKNPTFDAQLNGPVYQYLKKYAPFPTKQSLYMAVFYPAARTWPKEKYFPDNVRKANPGINTVQDYIDLVEGIKRPKKPIDFIKAVGIAAAIAGIIYLFAKKGTTL